MLSTIISPTKNEDDGALNRVSISSPFSSPLFHTLEHKDSNSVRWMSRGFESGDSAPLGATPTMFADFFLKADAEDCNGNID